MAKGNKIVPVRFEENKLIEIAVAIDQRNKRTREEPWNTSEFIRSAVEDKLNHLKRGRASSKAKAKGRKSVNAGKRP